MVKKILVTGANGFVGSHIVEALSHRDDVAVIVACRNKASLPSGFTGEIREGDLRDARYRQSLVKGVDVLCHAAAWTSMWGHAQESKTLFLDPTLALIDAAREAGVRRFINTSTTSAASPLASADPMTPGIKRDFWPHLCNVITIEDKLRSLASPSFQAVNLRLGIFAGRRYALGLLPILVPRLNTHLVPWVAGGHTSLPLIDGRDIGQAFSLAATAVLSQHYESFNVIGPEVPTVRDVITFLHDEYGLPLPHFGVPFSIAYAFSWLMEKLDPASPWEPLVTRSIIHLMEEVNADNGKATRLLGYQPQHRWQEAVRLQMSEMKARQKESMPMARPVV
jgi:nucleoside-diphosphate-sugar epimerase